MGILVLVARATCFLFFLDTKHLPSLEVADQTGLWMAERHNHRLPNEPYEIDLGRTEERASKLFENISRLFQLINTYIPVANLYKYEDIYRGGQVQLDVLNDARAFVGLPTLKGFTSKFVKQNAEDSYALILNREQLEEELGERYGYLGKQDTPAIWSEL